MRTAILLIAAIAAALPSTASAEPTFLAKQYTRCSACHYSPTGGGLLTPYGRLLSHRELSTIAGGATPPGAEAARRGEHEFLYGALGNALGPVQLGLEMRPSRLRVDFPGGHQDRSLLMTLDLVAAVQTNGWTAYGSIGREPGGAAVRNGRTLPDAAFISYDHWVSYQAGQGWGIRAGRFMPAFGVRFADHTTYTRANLGFGRADQVYGLEVSHAVGASLVQVTVSPGRAEAILHDADRRGFSATGRWQFDLTPRTTIVGSALYRESTNLDPESGAIGGAFGFAPTSRVTNWTEVDAELRAGSDQSWSIVNETSFEVHRGIWLKFSPQLRTSDGTPQRPTLRRLALGATLLPRTHWNVGLSYYRDRVLGTSTSVFLAQLHLYF